MVFVIRNTEYYKIDKTNIYRTALSDNGYMQTDSLTFININNNPLELYKVL